MWRRIKATVKPLKPRAAVQASPTPAKPVAADLSRGRPHPSAAPPATPGQVKGRVPKPILPQPLPPKRTPSTPIGSAPIDKSWERELRGGRFTPDMTIDLHGHYLAGAHTALSRALDRASSAGARIILVIAGKQRGLDEAPRGAIRRELTTWLAHSHHAGRILAIRNAHPRHGGAGAVYILLRKPAG